MQEDQDIEECINKVEQALYAVTNSMAAEYGNPASAYAMFQILVGLDNSDYWVQFLREALEEVVAQQQISDVC